MKPKKSDAADKKKEPSFLAEGDQKRSELLRLEEGFKKLKAEMKKKKGDGSSGCDSDGDDKDDTDFMPVVYNNLKPYSDTSAARRIFEEENQPLYEARVKLTAVGLVEPAIAQRMEVELDPLKEKCLTPRKSDLKQKAEKEELPPGSHRLPKMPRVNIDEGPYVNQVVDFDDVPRLRHEALMMYSAQSSSKEKEDCQRTRDDFYRMELHKLEMVRPGNRVMMANIYRAYLKNSPGSRKALRDCLKKTEERIGEKLLPEEIEKSSKGQSNRSG